MTDSHVTDLLERATDDLRVGPDLVARGIATGRRRRRRGLALTAVGATTVLALAGVVASALPGEGPGRDTSVAADPTPTAALPSTPPFTPAPSPGGAPVDLGAGPVWATLTVLLDDTGEVTRPRAWGESDFRAGSVLLDGAEVAVLVERRTEPRCGEIPPIATCERYGDGWLSTGTVAEVSAGQGETGVIGTTVTYTGPDGLAVVASALNASDEKGREPILDQPVLDVPALTAIATDPVWAAALP